MRPNSMKKISIFLILAFCFASFSYTQLMMRVGVFEECHAQKVVDYRDGEEFTCLEKN